MRKKFEDVSLNPQNLHKSRHTVQASVIKGRWELETGDSPEALGPVCLVYITKEQQREPISSKVAVWAKAWGCPLTTHIPNI